jgi:hypothetical protein
VAECYQKGMGKNGIKCDVIPAEGFQWGAFAFFGEPCLLLG